MGNEVFRNRTKILSLDNCFFLLADGSKLPFKDSSFYLILLSEVLEHIPPNLTKEVFEELKRVLMRDGTIIITVPSIFLDYKMHKECIFRDIIYSFDLSKTVKRQIMNQRIKKRKTFHNFFTKKELKEIIHENNLKLIKIHYVAKNNLMINEFMPSIFKRIIKGINNWLFKFNINKSENGSKKLLNLPNANLVPYRRNIFEYFPFFGNHILAIVSKR
jgi:SAM-dependent methyltransferase